MKEALKFAFPHTIPVMAGYIFMAIPFGILAVSQGLSPIIPVLMSILIFTGSLQFPAITFLVGSFDPINALVLTLMMGSRHIFYGIAMLMKFSEIDKKKYYSIFAMSDESFTLYVSIDIPPHIDKSWVYFFIGLLDQSYWIFGSLIGAILGQFLNFDLTGIEFVLTALFISIFVENWLNDSSNQPAITGLIAATFSLLVFGAANFMIPAMIIIISFFLWDFRKSGVKNT